VVGIAALLVMGCLGESLAEPAESPEQRTQADPTLTQKVQDIAARLLHADRSCWQGMRIAANVLRPRFVSLQPAWPNAQTSHRGHCEQPAARQWVRQWG
jgi:hypothetical protein